MMPVTRRSEGEKLVLSGRVCHLYILAGGANGGHDLGACHKEQQRGELMWKVEGATPAS